MFRRQIYDGPVKSVRNVVCGLHKIAVAAFDKGKVFIVALRITPQRIYVHIAVYRFEGFCFRPAEETDENIAGTFGRAVIFRGLAVRYFFAFQQFAVISVIIDRICIDFISRGNGEIGFHGYFGTRGLDRVAHFPALESIPFYRGRGGQRQFRSEVHDFRRGSIAFKFAQRIGNVAKLVPKRRNGQIFGNLHLFACGFGRFSDFPAHEFLSVNGGSGRKADLFAHFHGNRRGRSAFCAAQSISYRIGFGPIGFQRHVAGDLIFRESPKSIAVFPAVERISRADRLFGHSEQFVHRSFHGIIFTAAAVIVERNFGLFVTGDERKRRRTDNDHCNQKPFELLHTPLLLLFGGRYRRLYR